ncbi:argininosuccinate lyase [Camelliibacillus cellulosilyticus]|uniref:Argininosuccinate lyase n=1 Tax=Camelliibacillus cellulosilyticus TaxID=2174486 RepID=A0ABV9GRU1_9BACL
MNKCTEAIYADEGKAFPGSTYAEVVLAPAYQNAKKVLLDPMLAINKAHLIMLKEQALISEEDAETIARAIHHLNLEEIKQSEYDGCFEDLFFFVEDRIMAAAGEIGGNLHLARSRNDMGVAMYRMTLRNKLLQVIQAAQTFQESLLDVAKEHADTLMLGYTHTQQAQPMTFAHYLLAVYDFVGRDVQRLKAAYDTCNKSSMGAAALTTSGFNINRARMAELLGFQGIVENSYDAIAGADYLGETATAVKLALINLGRFAQDLLQWSTQEFSVVRVADPYVQISSIMPQKRNPVSLEHIRALSSSGVGSASSVLQMIHNTPFGDINDTEDDLQPHIWKSLALTEQVYRLSRVVVGTLQINKKVAEQRAKDSFATITELADTLVRECQIPFRTAHAIVSAVVKMCLTRNLHVSDITKDMITEAAVKVSGKPLNLSDEVVKRALDPWHFVKIRALPGGPAPEETTRMVKERQAALKSARTLLKKEITRVKSAIDDLDKMTEKWSQAQ